jgi:hypothetical protein
MSLSVPCHDGLTRTTLKKKKKARTRFILLFKNLESCRHPWLMPVILAAQEAEIRRIAVRRQAWANSLQDPISKKAITK